MRTHAIALAAGLIAGLATTAQADFIREVATGTFDVVSDDGTSRVLSHDLAVVSEIGGWGFLTIDAETEHTFQAGSDPLTGTAFLYGATTDDFLEIALTGVLDGQSGQQNFSFSGLWETVDAGGAYAGLVGSGDFSGSGYYTANDSGLVDWIFQGDLVPAPASAALLGAAGLFATRRRR